MKKCTRCGNSFKESEFPFTNKAKGKRFSMCFTCKKEYDREYWAKTKDVRNERKRKNSKSNIKRNADYVISHLKKNPCVDCGEGNIIVLEFDHQRDKSFNVSHGIRAGYSLESIQNEIDKCEVVCANCHRLRTAKQFNWQKGRDA